MIFFFSAKIREAHERDVREYRRSLVDDRPKKRKSSDLTQGLPKSESRRSLCAACSEKWKEQLPTPKVSFLRNKKKILDDNVMKCFLSKSTYMITNMIKEEIEKMEQRERELKYAKREKKKEQPEKSKPIFRNSDTGRKSNYLLKKSKNYSPLFSNKPQENSMLMNNLNLAKIKNQISAKECDIRVKKFLDEPICVDT